MSKENTPIVVPFRTKPSAGDVEADKRAAEEKRANEKPTEQPKQQAQLVPFPDGAMLKFQPNKSRPGTFVINDGAGTPYAVALHPEIAELICKSVTILFHQEMERQKQREATAAALTDSLPAAGEKVEVQPTPAPDGNKS